MFDYVQSTRPSVLFTQVDRWFSFLGGDFFAKKAGDQTFVAVCNVDVRVRLPAWYVQFTQSSPVLLTRAIFRDRTGANFQAVDVFYV